MLKQKKKKSRSSFLNADDLDNDKSYEIDGLRVSQVFINKSFIVAL